MRIIEGYVFIGSFGEPLIENLFGPRKSQVLKYSENLESNGLALFEKEKQARETMAIYQKAMQRHLDELRTTPAYLWLKISENREEAEKAFAKSRDLAVIASDHNETGVGDILMGRRVEGKPSQYPLYGATMCLNGFATIRRLDDALYLASEANRQGGFSCQIARFKLKRLVA